MPAESTLHLGAPVDAAWGRLPEGTRVGPANGDADASDGSGGSGAGDGSGGSGAGDAPERVVVRLRDDEDPGDRLGSVRSRYPDAAVFAYSVDDLPDAAIDASRLGVEYVSGRRLAADGETLADRLDADGTLAEPSPGDEGAAGGSGNALNVEVESALEPFIRIVSDRAADLDEKLDALLELGRDRLGLSIGYSSRIDEDRLELRRYSDGTGLLDSLAESELDDDGSVPLELTYCQRTVRSDDVFAFTDPEAAGLKGDPAYEEFGFGSYVGGRVVVNGETYGTLCFLDPERRDRPFDESERLFVELLAGWLGRAIERRVAREEREAAVARFEDTLERIDDAFFALDEEWRFTYVNEKAAALLDRDPDELLGADVWAEFPAAIGEEYERNYRRAMETQEPISFEDYYEPLDLWTEVTAYPSSDGLSVFFTDATDRKQRERVLERLLGTVEELQRTDSREAVADRLIEAADEVLGYEISGVRLYDPDDDRLRLAATSDGLGDRFADSRGPRRPGEGISGRVFERGEPRVDGDLAEVEDDRAYHGMRSVAAVPLGDQGTFIVGAVEPDAFDEDDVSVLELLATNAVAAMDAADRRRRLRTYEDALKNVDDMVCVLDGEGAVTYATAPFAAWVGADDSDDIVGRPLDALVDAPDATRVTEAVTALTDPSNGVEGGPEPARTVELTTERDGDRHPRHGQLRLSRLSDHGGGVVGSLSDTTDLQRTRTELSTERDRFRRLFDRIPDPVMEVVLEDDETVIDGLNPAFETQFGADEASLRGRTIGALDIQDDRLGDSDRGGDEEDDLDALVRDRGFATREVRRQTVDGPREFLFRGFSYETEGARRAFGIYTDITDRKRRERYVRIVNRILRHNVRNELNVVFGFAGEIAGRTDDDAIRDFAERIEATGKRLAGVADGATTLRRVVEEGYVTDPDSIDVRAVVEEAVERHAGERPDTRITADVPDGTAVRGDDRLSVAVDHLVENAVEHGGDAPRVTVTAGRDPDAGVVTVRVADDGPGIATAVQEVVTGDRKVTQLRHNTGIGLWIAAWVVEAYGGEIRFGPGLDGEGTTVTLALPAAEPAETGADDAEA
ncbi:PAS domain S-box protein [Halorubrum sp. GN11_10-6_MGM]|uniref:PAS domain-containing protein n=1 Tax=Halorubrum sp. GN11_10-6_MGM TaxID=2518112 RepID=UPI0010F6D2C1|nr:PAS domain-containing protein [Halorubrum sp. GN11_10-6_MGM]TKX75616.1 PAS domain S-box protein [Halorubrum sp. GN11_10-6_MGM]